MVVFNKDCRKQFLLPDRVLVPMKKPTEIVNGLFTKKANKLVIDHDPSDPRLLCERPRHREGGQRQGLAEQVWANDFLPLVTIRALRTWMNVFRMVRSEGSSQVTWLWLQRSECPRVFHLKSKNGPRKLCVASLHHSCKFATFLSRLGSEFAES